MISDIRVSIFGGALLAFLCLAPSLHGQYLPEGAEDWYLWTEDGHRLYVAELARTDTPRDTVVVLHGGWGAEHSGLWSAVAPLADHYHFVLYDQRGSLRSPPADSTLSLDRLVADLEELRRELGREELTLVGHSMGTRLAYEYLRQHPDRVRRLVAVSAVPVVPRDGDPVSVEMLQEARERFDNFHQEQVLRQMETEGLDPEEDPRSSRERTDRWRIAFAAANVFQVERWRELRGGQAFYNAEAGQLVMENTPDEQLELHFHYETLRESDVPVRVIVGDHDLVDFGLVAWPKLVERMPKVELETLEDAGHIPWIDRPDGFRDALLGALEASREN